jgi:general secretion pathway protein D
MKMLDLKRFAVVSTIVVIAAGASTAPGQTLPGVIRPPSRIPVPTRPPAAAPVPATAPAAGVPETGPEAAPPAAAAANGGDVEKSEDGRKLNLVNTAIDLVLEHYATVVGKVVLQHPQTPKATVTLKSLKPLSDEDYLQAIETILAMNGVGIVPVGDKFLKVVPIQTVRTEGALVRETAPTNTVNGKTGEMISQLISVYYIDLAEARKVVDHLKHPYAQIQNFDRNNTMLITDTEDNINRIVQVLKIVDQPSEIREETHIVKIRYTKASEIKKKIDEIIAEQQKSREAKPSTVPPIPKSGAPVIAPTTVPGIPGVIRARPPVSAATTPTTDVEAALAMIEDVERGIIQGTVRIVADDRTNILIIITRPENMKIFNKIVDVLDVETAPEVEVRYFRLEFSEAKSIAQMLNELIGAATKQDAVKPHPGAAPSVPGTPEAAAEARSTTLREIEARIAASQPASGGKSKIGELSKENIKILSDERTNSLIIMASKRDISTLGEIIKNLDMMLSQVLIEAVILDVKLSDEVQTGADWLQRSMIAYNQRADGSRRATAAFGGRLGGGSGTPVDAASATVFPSGGGLSYYFTFFGLNVDAVIQMVAKDSRSRVVSTPVILTTDNKEAKITSTDQIYIYSGKKYDQYQNPYDDYAMKDVGLTLTVKPHINENKVVMMDIAQTMSEPGLTGAPQSGAKVSSQRTLNASIAVRDRQTIVLGGQVRDDISRSRTKVPLLGDIPLLGRLFTYNSSSKGRLETVVFITPYVLDDSNALDAETFKRSRVLSISNSCMKGWADSELGISGTAPDARKAGGAVKESAATNAAPRKGAAVPDVPAPEGAKRD